MKKLPHYLFVSAMLLLHLKANAGNYSDKIFKSDTVLKVIHETQIGRNFDGGSNKLYTYQTKLGIQLYCFQFGAHAEREFNNTSAYNQDYLQRTKALGLFFGFELPVTKKLDIGLLGVYSTYKPNLEQPVFISNNTNIKLFLWGNYNIFQTQLRLNYQLNKAFSLIGTANFNTSPSVYNEGQINQNNFFRVNLGLRYSLYSLNNDSNHSMEVNNRSISIFAGSNMGWKNSTIPGFIGKETTVQNTELLQLAESTGDNSKSQVFAMLGIADKRNNMILFGFNQRDYIQYATNYKKLNSNSNWKLTMSDMSARLAIELNLFSLAGDKMVNNFKPVYPFFRSTATYSNKNFSVLEGWDSRTYATDSTGYQPRIDNKAQTKSIEINNSLGLAMKLNKLYISAGFNLFNRTYGEVKYERTVTRDYYQNVPPQNYIESKTETLPVLETKGWLAKPLEPMNLFFTIGLLL